MWARPTPPAASSANSQNKRAGIVQVLANNYPPRLECLVSVDSNELSTPIGPVCPSCGGSLVVLVHKLLSWFDRTRAPQEASKLLIWQTLQTRVHVVPQLLTLRRQMPYAPPEKAIVWDRLLYCAGCDVVFDAVTKRYVLPADAKWLLE